MVSGSWDRFPLPLPLDLQVNSEYLSFLSPWLLRGLSLHRKSKGMLIDSQRSPHNPIDTPSLSRTPQNLIHLFPSSIAQEALGLG